MIQNWNGYVNKFGSHSKLSRDINNGFLDNLLHGIAEAEVIVPASGAGNFAEVENDFGPDVLTFVFRHR